MSFLKNTSLVSVAELIAGLIAFFFTLIAARFLGVNDYGLFQAVMGICGIFAFVLFPFRVVTIHCMNRTSGSQAASIAAGFIRFAFLSGGILFLCLALTSLGLRQILHTRSFLPIALAGLFTLTTTLVTVIYGILQARLDFKAFAVSRIVQSLLALGIGTSLMAAGWGPSGALLGYIAGTFGITLFFLTRPGFCDWHQKDLSGILKELSVINKIIASFFFIALVDSLPVLWARIWLDHGSSGIFGALYNLRNVLWPFALGILTPFYTALASPQAGKNLLKKALVLVFLLGFVFITAGFLCPETIIRTLYGPDFLPAAEFMSGYGLSLLLEMLVMILLFHKIAVKTFRWADLFIPGGVFILMMLFFTPAISQLIIAQITASFSFFGLQPFQKSRQTQEALNR